jgi:hypothetical protein
MIDFSETTGNEMIMEPVTITGTKPPYAIIAAAFFVLWLLTKKK